MKRFIISALATLITATTYTSAIADDTQWAPTDFDGAWVEVIDNAQNGCWTNIGEVRDYATDQLELAGFKIIERPQDPINSLAPSAGKKIMFVIDVTGKRWNNGMCVGSLVTYFYGRVIISPLQLRWVPSPIDRPLNQPIWHESNFNTIMWDSIKNSISDWVERGDLTRLKAD